jgi:hypothetical protein
MRARPCDVPSGTRISQHIDGAYFFDSFQIEVPSTAQTSLSLLLTMLSRTPGWVDVLMRLRNRAVQLVGLKNVGKLADVKSAKPESAYRPGDRVGVFTLHSSEPDEVIVGDNDKHLEAFVALTRLPATQEGRQYISITTVVHVHNMLGRLYLLPVAPMHKLVAPAMLSRLAG